MSTFKLAAKRGVKFRYQIGSVSTEKAWGKPNMVILSRFCHAIKNIKNYEKYQLFLVGGVVNGGIDVTTDVDILVTGHVDIFQLEKFLHDLHHLGLNEFGLLIDAKWIDDKPSETLEPRTYKAIQFGRVVKQIGEHESVIDLFENNTKLTDFLVLRTIEFPKAKTKQTNNKFVRI